MYTVTLTSWTSGFVANRLIDLLRRHGFGLAEAHGLASRFVNGEAVALSLSTELQAERFAQEARCLGVDLHVHRTAGVAS